jgi:cell division protein FtsI (penicillin-binding protein 3)
MAAAPVFKNIGEQILNCFKTNIRKKPAMEQETANKMRLISAGHNYSQQNMSGDDESGMPDFTGLTIRQALRKAKANSIELSVSGNGWALRQYPRASTPLGDERVCKVVFGLND